MMTDGQHYAIRGGAAGRERLRILARVMRSRTTALFERAGLRDGMLCLDAGCGGGDVTLENIADAVLQDNLASREELGALVRELYEFAENPRTVAGLPRVVQAWGRKAASVT